MEKREEFKHYMLAGHGRAFKLLENNRENFRDIVLYGCLNDISFDMQCEGSRGYYMYNLVWEYGDSEYFLKQATEKFLTDYINDDWHTICHLCDFIRLFWENDGIQAVHSALAQKYGNLYSQIMTMNFSEGVKEITDSFEYLAITLMQIEDFDYTLEIFKDMGEYFIKREETSDDNLKWLFAWFYAETKEKYGEDFLQEELEKHSEDSEKIRRFKRVMNTPDMHYVKKERPEPTAENYIKQAKNDTLRQGYIAYFKRNANDGEKIKLANAFVSETDFEIKAKLLNAFTDGNLFPLDPKLFVEYAKSNPNAPDSHKDDIQFINMETNLHNAVLKSMSCIRADCVHDYAAEMLDKDESGYLLYTLIYNCRESDREIIFNRLNSLKFDIDNRSGWHGVIFKIIDTAEDINTPNNLLNDLLMFAYEKSLCSKCRENIVEELAVRNLLTQDMIDECRFDSNVEIREKVDNLYKKILADS